MTNSRLSRLSGPVHWTAIGIAAMVWLSTLPLLATAQETVRPEVGKPLQAAQELLKTAHYKEALAKIRDSDGIAGKTEHELYLIERLRASAALGAGDHATAIRAFETVISSGKAGAGDQLKMVEALAGSYYRSKDYPATVKWVTRYFKDGGSDPQMRMLLIHSYFQNGDVANAAKEASADIQADVKAGRTPSEDKLLLLASCYLKQNNSPAYIATIEKLLTHYPKKTLWADVISRLKSKSGFADRLALDLYRLQFATGNLQSTADYTEMAQLALMAGLPNEAKKVVDEGYANGALGKGTDVERQKRLKDLIEKSFADSLKALPSGKLEEAANAAQDGNALVRLGLNLGPTKGIPLIEAGIKKGSLKYPEDAKLHLGILLSQAGQKAKAAQMLKTVQGNDGVRELANLWVMFAR